ncbi:jg8837 [Pararge aegeria aegeria]|uniref:Jg8837 protein n=1 Tax=Pararge aegeria aegeria TaxID=348720 RepID=A0A8S4SN49_9NEOP|nr:jg8837 [Pararge aegeria aegeria]
MEKYLRPDRFDGDSSLSSTSPEWEHWKRTFNNFLAAQAVSAAPNAQAVSDDTKLQLLINHISPRVFRSNSDCTTYATAITPLDVLYIKPIKRI